jgi:hypothetical protein
LAGGYLIGYSSGSQNQLKSVLGGLHGVVQAIPFLPGLVSSLPTSEWYLASGLILITVGIILVVLGGGQPKPKRMEAKAEPEVPVYPPGSCKFCGADLKGSTTYCPSCGKSQT